VLPQGFSNVQLACILVAGDAAMNKEQPAKQISVFIVSEFEPLRLGLGEGVTRAPDLELIGSSDTLEEMVQLGGVRNADVIIIDTPALNRADMPRVYRGVSEWFPALRVLFLGSIEDGLSISPEDVPAYMSMGTVGFVYKTGGIDRLLDATRVIAAGGFVCETEVIRRILTRLINWTSDPAPTNGDLSAREMQVLNLVARARSNKEIALELFVSEGTVKAHVSHIMSKLGMERRAELVRYALTSGLVDVTEGAS
jgi:DNA-binding NarL/FixJ family response regulator